MKSYDYNAVVYANTIYCVGCVPDNAKEEDVHPIFANSEWFKEYPVCDSCLKVHDYVTLITNDSNPGGPAMTQAQQPHTEGKLCLFGCNIRTQQIQSRAGIGIAITYGNIGQPAQANAERIVALWNAFDGIPTEEITSTAIITKFSTLRADNARMKEALIYLADYANGETIASTLEFSHIVTKARAALAQSAEEEK